MTSESLLFAYDYNLLTICWMDECGTFGESCDLAFLSCEPAMRKRLEESGRFPNIFMLGESRLGKSFAQRRVDAVELLESGGRFYRAKTRLMELADIGAFYGKGPGEYRRIFYPDSYFLDPNETLLMNGFRTRPTPIHIWEHAIVGGLLDLKVMPGYFESARGLLCGAFGVRQPPHFVEGFHFFSPEVVRESLDRHNQKAFAVPRIDRTREGFRDETNRLFGLKETDINLLDEYDCVVLPIFSADAEIRSRWLALLDKCARVLGRENMVIKHRANAIMEEPGYESYVNYAPGSIPFEMNVLNARKTDAHLFLAAFTTNAALTPKMHFDDEPYVVILEDVIWGPRPFEIFKQREGVRKLYRNPEKFCIPKTEEEALSFIEAYASQRRKKNGA